MAQRSSSSSTNPRRRQSSTHQPMHRRPFYSQNTTSYDIYTSKNRRSTSSRNAKVVLDQGLDNFSYDPDHLLSFKIPAELTVKMPKELLIEAQNWTLAGAALCTNLDRIHELYKQAIPYAYPIFDHPIVAGSRLKARPKSAAHVDTPPSSTRTPVLAPIALDSRISSMTLLLETDPATMGVFSPPITPILDHGSASPIETEPEDANSLPKMSTLSRFDSHSSACAISPSTSFSTATKDLPHRGPHFDEISWETYLNKFRAELDDARYCLSRFQGYAKKINVLRREYLIEGESERNETVGEFIDWWIEHEPKVSELQRRVEDLEMPDMDYVRVEWDLERHEQAGTISASEMVFSRE
nr:hypothetical protein CFP56_53219 [Quercus suber]